MKKHLHLLAALALLAASIPTSFAGLFSGEPKTEFPPSRTFGGVDLARQGQGVLRYKRLIPVYDAAYYLGEERDGDAARRIEVVYRVNAKAERFTRAGDRLLEATLEPDRWAEIRDRLDRLNRLYPDARKGDRCAITYLPGRGTTLSFNDRDLGTVEGADFARAYFSIWLGDSPACADLRMALLGKNESQ